MDPKHFEVFRAVPVYPGEQVTPPAEISDYDLQMIHAGLMLATDKQIMSMSRELRKWRGHPHPDSV